MRSRDEWVEKVKGKLDEWNAELDRLEAKARTAKRERRAQYERQISRLKEYRSRAREELEEVQRASDDAWDELKEGAQKSWRALVEGFRAALDEFREDQPKPASSPTNLPRSAEEEQDRPQSEG